MDDFSTFETTLMIGEEMLDLSYSNYQDAFTFSKEHYSQMSSYLFEYYRNHCSEKDDHYKLDLLRYAFIKAIENRISSDIFSNTKRGNMCDVLYSPLDMSLKSYPTNLPRFLDDIVNAQQELGIELSNSINKGIVTRALSFDVNTLNAVTFLGHTIGHHISLDNQTYASYDVSDFLTRKELLQLALINVLNWMTSNGYKVLEWNSSLEAVQHIVATRNNDLIFVRISAEVAPTRPGFTQEELDLFYNTSKMSDAIPYYACIDIGSKNTQHFNDGVLLYNDESMYRVSAFGELEADS